jgi:hypothetical protein
MDRYEDPIQTGLEQARGLIIGQCTTGVKAKLERRPNRETERSSHDPVTILKAVREVTYSTEEHEFPLLALHRALMGLLTCGQLENESLHAYMKRFKNAHELLLTQQKKSPKIATTFADNSKITTDEAWKQFVTMVFVPP